MECPRIAPNAPKLPVGTRLEGVPPTPLMGSGTADAFSGDALPKTWSQSRRLAVYYPSWEAKMEIPGYTVGQFQRPK